MIIVKTYSYNQKKVKLFQKTKKVLVVWGRGEPFLFFSKVGEIV